MYKGFYLFLLVVVFSQYCTVIVGIAIVVAEYREILCRPVCAAAYCR